MERYQSLFAQCRENNSIAFIPFVMLGDPDLETSYQIITTLIDSGADALELGIPFSDPVADGPTIQAAAIRALQADVTPKQCFELLQRVRAYAPSIPIGLLLYSNLVYRDGIEHFYQRCRTADIDSLLIADVPMRETNVFDEYALQNRIAPVHILPPTPSEKTLMTVAKRSRGYTYVLGRAGVTGTESQAVMPSNETMQALTDYQAAPPVMGFGISSPDHVMQAKAHGFSGVISGSAVVKIIEEYRQDPSSMCQALKTFVQQMKAAT